MADHTVKIVLVDDHALPELPPDGAVRVGDFVKYESEAGSVRVVFDSQHSPFNGAIVDGGELRKVINSGTFSCKCFITLPDRREVGWREGESPESGGEHDVRP